MLGNVIVSGQEEATRTCGWIANGVVGGGLHAIHDGLDKFTGSEVLARPFRTLSGALGEQPFVDVPLHVGLHGGPFLHVNQVHDQPSQRSRVLDFGPCLLEDFAQHSRLFSEFFEDVPIVGYEFVVLPLQQAFPIELSRNDGRLVVRRLRLFIRHLEKEQERDLLCVVHVREAVVPENMGKVPSLVDDLLTVVAHEFFPRLRLSA